MWHVIKVHLYRISTFNNVSINFEEQLEIPFQFTYLYYFFTHATKNIVTMKAIFPLINNCKTHCTMFT